MSIVNDIEVLRQALRTLEAEESDNARIRVVIPPADDLGANDIRVSIERTTVEAEASDIHGQPSSFRNQYQLTVGCKVTLRNSDYLWNLFDRCITALVDADRSIMLREAMLLEEESANSLDHGIIGRLSYLHV